MKGIVGLRNEGKLISELNEFQLGPKFLEINEFYYIKEVQSLLAERTIRQSRK